MNKIINEDEDILVLENHRTDGFQSSGTTAQGKGSIGSPIFCPLLPLPKEGRLPLSLHIRRTFKY